LTEQKECRSGKPSEKPKREKLSLYPLSIEEALRAAAQTGRPQKAGEKPASKPKVTLKEIRGRHREKARLVSEGHEVGKIAELTGSKPEQILSLMEDPSFRELVARYKRIAKDGSRSD